MRTKLFDKKTSTVKILLVDDDPDMTTMLQMYLKAKGYEVDTAADGLECLEKVARSHPDLILLDSTMPQLNGPQTLEKLHANKATAKIPVVMVTGRADQSDLAGARKHGVVDYVVKPFDYDVLLEKMTKILS